MVGLFLTTFNQRQDTEITVQSLFAVTEHPFRLVIVDNASDDGTVDWAKARGIDVIENDEPVDLSVALNQGLDFFLRQEDIRYIGWIHNDMTFYSCWLKRLVALLETHPGVGKLAPDSMHLYGPNDPDQAERIMAAHQGDMRTGNACPWIMPKEVARKTGYFDERFVSCGGYEDWDYNNRLLEFGYDVMITKASLVWHPTMGTRKHRDLSRAAEKNAEWYYRKWGTYAPRV